ncbi:general L-amino acid transport system substrate-binding protein [Pseudochelatococcus lubricantis]|uniref:General L-amino acid transport system substrate-binding protein n=1 Tax=Pseudochelatococcus lubricantis TaxID=1538102 RepID=A0ABX0UWV1_9HYPH|nr:amino acid ABC transporter substrate-binding protein [Pseudochelatococcus lubricantis]NIJ57416.1 general L-amino acid transport system substrate-binding protein [Pseudochelatococcus lubricantis]
MKKSLLAAIVTVAAFGAAGASAATLDQVKQRGVLHCGSNPGLAGFAVADDKGQWTGFDVAFCRAVAAAIFDDPAKVRFIPLTAKDRFTAVQSGEVDVLIRNTTWTMSRDTSLGLNLGPVNYYDGQGFIVRSSLGLKSAKELEGASVCVQQGTTTELNLADFFRANNIKYEPVTYASAVEAVKAYDSGRCDAFTTDASALYAERLRLTAPDEHVVLPEIISKEPFAPVVRHGDDQWFDLVQWTVNATINAEELGVTKANVDEQLKSENPEVRRLLGVEGNFGEGIGLPADWAVRIIRHVGNYGEIFAANLGPDSPLKIDRGLNRLWTNGGILYAPPIR